MLTSVDRSVLITREKEMNRSIEIQTRSIAMRSIRDNAFPVCDVSLSLMRYRRGERTVRIQFEKQSVMNLPGANTMTARRFPCLFAFLSIMILLGTDHSAFGRQAAAEARSQTKENRGKTDGKPRTVQVATIKKTDLYNYNGRYQVTAYPSRTAKLYTNTPGTIRGLKLRLGDHVKQGETIAEIESAELRREIETRELSVRRAEIALERTKAEIRRMEKLIDIKKAEPFDIKKKPETIESELGVLRDELEIAKLKMEEAKINFEEAKLSLHQARDRLASSRYVAPFEGDVIEVNVADGDRVVPTGVETGKPAFVLGDFRMIHYKYENEFVTLTSRDVIEPGMKAVICSVYEESEPISFGRVVWVDPHRDKSTSAGRYIVEAPNPVKTMKYLDEAWVSIRTTFQKSVLTIPTRAYAYDGNVLQSSYCCLIADEKIKKTKIQISSGGLDIDDARLTIDPGIRNNNILVGAFGMITHQVDKNEEDYNAKFKRIHHVDKVELGLKEGDVVVVAVESGSIEDLVDGEKVVIKPANEKDKIDP